MNCSNSHQLKPTEIWVAAFSAVCDKSNQFDMLETFRCRRWKQRDTNTAGRNQDCINKCQSSRNGKFNERKQWNFGSENDSKPNFLRWLCCDFETSFWFQLTSSNKCGKTSMGFVFTSFWRERQQKLWFASMDIQTESWDRSLLHSNVGAMNDDSLDTNR
jgi:hypothetical protein